MIYDVKISDGKNEFYLINYDTYKDAVKDMCKTLNCTEESLDKELEGFTKELLDDEDNVVEGYFGFDEMFLKDILSGLDYLNEYDNRDKRVILAYIDDAALTLSINNIKDALDCFFGEYDSDYDAAYDYLSYEGFTTTQTLFCLNDLDAEDKIMYKFLYKIDNLYYYNENQY